MKKLNSIWIFLAVLVLSCMLGCRGNHGATNNEVLTYNK